MTESKICTCPSGDGSLRWPCPAHPAVDQADVAAKLTFINGRPAMCGCQVEYSDGGGEYSDVIYVTLCAKHSGSAILDLVATNRIALTPEYEGQWHADLYLDREIPLAKVEGATPAEAVLALMSAERIDPEQESVEQAGGDERAAFELFVRKHCGMPEHIAVNWDAKFTNDAWEGWQARAALAQPSPVRSSLLINGYQLRAALDFIAPDGTAEQLKSEACIEWRQQDADFLEAGLYAFCAEYPEEGGVLLDEEPTTAQPSPLQSEQAEAERPEVAEVAFVLRNIGAMDAEDIDGDNVDLRFEDAEGRDTGCDVSIVEYAEKAADLFEQHDRIVGALRAKADQLREALEWRAENQAGQRELLRSVKAERDAALARVAELERQESVALANRGNQGFWVEWTEAAAGLYGSGIKLYAAPVARAQHSVPDGYRLIRLEHFAAIKAQLDPEQVDAYRGRNIYDEDKVYANWNACRSALDEIKDVFQQIDWDAENELAELLAAAPGKEVPQAWLDVQAERRRQVEVEGYHGFRDNHYISYELSKAARAYIEVSWHALSGGLPCKKPESWPWMAGFKWSDGRTMLVKACALVLAEIERLDRAAHGKEVGHE
ncbi:hypothetical protein [Pseudomonas aeruginosa]|uniref:hypothetical protein n=1 Tax=Pseudomonas aeruginosa TaxID=287 RepID=UPI0009A1D24C|nr:hypothetical protein [Pseudomonas aeruginosa]